jgi:hypothetical protein
LGEAKLQEFVDRLSHVATIESPLSHQGKIISISLAPRKDIKQRPSTLTVSVPKPVESQPIQPVQSVQQTQTLPEVLEPPTETTQTEARETPKVIEVVSDEK